MIFKNFTINIIIRTVLIVVSIGLLMYCSFALQLYLRSFYILLFAIVCIVELIYYVNKTNRDIASFLTAIQQNDFTNTYPEKGKGKSFAMLYETFNQITDKFRTLGAEKESQHLYLEMLVEHVQVGIISFDSTGQIHLMNSAMKNLIGHSFIPTLFALERVDKPLAGVLLKLEPGENKLHKAVLDHRVMLLALHASEFILKGKPHKLISAQNIKAELEAGEMEAWQKLIRVLTHEIMNSVSPISSLSDTLHRMVKSKAESPTPEMIENLEQGLEAIKIRSQGLQNFTEAYKSLTRIPQPVLVHFSVIDWFAPLQKLFENEMLEKTIDFKIQVPAPITILGDKELLGQVMVNLIRNAIDAVAANTEKKIILSATEIGDKIAIEVADNGEGIPSDTLDKIFIPFFTTKENGSGIGLALSKQILQLHQASIQVESGNHGTTFKILI